MGIRSSRGECLSEEVVAAAVADLRGERRVEDRVDRQRQGDDAVTSVNGLQRVGVRARGSEHLPEEIVAAAFADLSGEGRVEDRVDRQSQGNDAVAAVNGLQRVGIGSRCSECLPEEVVATAFADLGGEGRVEDRVDRQSQGNDAVATVNALQGVGVCTRCGERLPEEVVAAAVADLRGEGGVEDVVDSQVEGIHARTSVSVGIGIGVGAAHRISLTVPSEALAGSFRHGVVSAVVDGQVEGVHARAAVSVSVSVGVGAAFRVSLTVPSEALACGLRHGVVGTVVDGQLQCVKDRTAVGVRVRVIVSS